jgi:hypothetical protein
MLKNYNWGKTISGLCASNDDECALNSVDEDFGEEEDTFSKLGEKV